MCPLYMNGQFVSFAGGFCTRPTLRSIKHCRYLSGYAMYIQCCRPHRNHWSSFNVLATLLCFQHGESVRCNTLVSVYPAQIVVCFAGVGGGTQLSQSVTAFPCRRLFRTLPKTSPTTTKLVRGSMHVIHRFQQRHKAPRNTPFLLRSFGRQPSSWRTWTEKVHEFLIRLRAASTNGDIDILACYVAVVVA